jgi:hypothetical protein
MFTISAHARKQIDEKGFDVNSVLAAADYPHVSYDNGYYPGQRRHIRDGLAVIVDPASKRIVTVYAHKVETDTREDQVGKSSPTAQRRRGQAARAARKGGK